MRDRPDPFVVFGVKDFVGQHHQHPIVDFSDVGVAGFRDSGGVEFAFLGLDAEVEAMLGRHCSGSVEIGTTCCFATQDKVWVTRPTGEKWEVYTVRADSDTFGTSPQQAGDSDDAVCSGGSSKETETTAASCC